jgi:DUF1009 family protein
MQKVGIIAGDGNLAHIAISGCIGRGLKPFIVKISSESDSDFHGYSDLIFSKIGEVTKIIDFFRKNHITKILFAGKVNRPSSLSQVKVDSLGVKLITKISANKIFGDNSSLSTIKDFLLELGFEVIAVNEIISNLVVSAGVLSKRAPTEVELTNIELGVEVIGAISRFDIGQSVVVSNQRVVSIEAAEGTDEMLARSKKFLRTDGCLIKIPKINQIIEIDLPCIGIVTLQKAFEVGIIGVAIKSEGTILLDKDQVIEFVNKNNMFLVSIK